MMPKVPMVRQVLIFFMNEFLRFTTKNEVGILVTEPILIVSVKFNVCTMELDFN